MLRLKSSTDFERVRRDGRTHAHPLVVLVARQRPPGELATGGSGAASAGECPRFGFVAGKSVGKAVARNRAKRLLRAAAQGLAPLVLPGWDLMLIARAPLAETRLAETQAALAGLLRRARVLRDVKKND